MLHPPPWMGLDLLSTFVLTQNVYVVFFRGRSGLRGWRRWVEVVSAPNSACGVGPVQDASAGAILWARAGSHVGRALAYHRSLFTSCYCLSRVSTSSPRRIVRWCTIWYNKCVSASWDWYLCHIQVNSYEGTLHMHMLLWWSLEQGRLVCCGKYYLMRIEQAS